MDKRVCMGKQKRFMKIAKINSEWKPSFGMLAGLGIVLVLILHLFRWWKDKELANLIRANRLSEQVQGPTLPLNPPKVSFLIPAWNEVNNINNCLVSILGLRYPNIEIIVSAGGTDQTFAFANAYASQGVKVLEQNRGDGKQKALQHCFENSTGDIIFLTDADCILEDSSFEKTLANILDHHEDVSAGGWQPLDRQRENHFVIYQWTHHIYRELKLPQYTPNIDGRNAAITRSALNKSQAFLHPAPIGTDIILSQQLAAAGYRVRSALLSRVKTEYPEGIPSYWNQQSRWFRNGFLIESMNQDRSGLFSYLKSGLASLFMLGVPLCLGLGQPVIWAVWLALFVHNIASQLRMIAFIKHTGDQVPVSLMQFLLIPFYLFVSWIGMSRGLIESILPGRKNHW
jgi:cellulose synthase/poly-beta-1,6-N-acetylglucosamine synthase-like glycosyltransferase